MHFTRRQLLKSGMVGIVAAPLVQALSGCTQCQGPSGAQQSGAPAGGASSEGNMNASAPAAAETPASGAASPSAPAAADAAGGLTLVDEKDPMAVTLKYSHTHATVPADLKVTKQGTEFDKQSCANCMFYNKAGELNGKEVGKCQMIPNGVVASEGWCSSWTLKQG